MLNNNRFLEKITSRTKIYLAIIAFLLIIICINKPVFIVPGIILFILIIIYSYWTNSKRNAELSRQIQNLTMTMDGTAKKSLINSPFPLIIIETTGNIIWKSSKFVYEFANIDINNYLIDILEEIKEDIEAQQDKKQKTITKKVQIGNKIYSVLGEYIRSKQNDKSEYITILYFLDITQIVKEKKKYEDSRTCVGILMVDNYEEIIQRIDVENRPQVIAEIEKVIYDWAASSGGIVVKNDRNTFVYVFEYKYLKEIKENKFDILDQIKEINVEAGIQLTLSIAISIDGDTNYDKYKTALESMDIVLGRGGDQAVVKENGEHSNRKSLSIAFIIVLVAVLLFTAIGMILMRKQPLVLQGQVETTEIRISGKLPGRIDTFLVREGDWVKQGDTLVVINSPTIEAKYRQVDALEQVAVQQNKKIDAGTRRQIIATAQQLWNKTKSDLTLAKTTYDRILTLYKDSVVTSQRKDEVEAMYKAAVAAERAAYEQYQMAVDGAQSEDKASARSLVNAARSTVDEVTSLLMDARLTAPEDGQIATIFPKRGELVAPGTPIMNLVVMSDVHAVLNVREDLMPNFRIGGKFVADVPAIARKNVEFEVYYISPLGSFATWKSTKQTGSYDLQTFEIHARPTQTIDGLRPGMSVLLTLE